MSRPLYLNPNWNGMVTNLKQKVRHIKVPNSSNSFIPLRLQVLPKRFQIARQVRWHLKRSSTFQYRSMSPCRTARCVKELSNCLKLSAAKINGRHLLLYVKQIYTIFSNVGIWVAEGSTRLHCNLRRKGEARFQIVAFNKSDLFQAFRVKFDRKRHLSGF